MYIVSYRSQVGRRIYQYCTSTGTGTGNNTGTSTVRVPVPVTIPVPVSLHSLVPIMTVEPTRYQYDTAHEAAGL